MPHPRAEDDWHYIDSSGNPSDPLSRDELLAAHYSGKISGSTLVWRQGLGEWTPLLSTLTNYNSSPAPQEAQSNSSTNASEPVGNRAGISASGARHPWLRYFAKWMDCLLLATPIATFLISANANSADGAALRNPVAASLFTFIIWIPIEAALLSTLGTTPARWLLGLKVTDINGNKLTFNNAAIRAFHLALRGLAFGIFPIAPATMYFAYKRLKKTGNTYWDIAANSIVTYKSPGQFKSMLFGLLAVVCVIMILDRL